MKATKHTYESTGKFSHLFLDYVKADPFLNDFYVHRPSLAAFADAIKARKAKDTDRGILAEALTAQYSRQAPEWSSSVQELIQTLRSSDTFTITTGHQLNLFTGPLYSIYKIATVVKMASELKKEFRDCNFIPVFWMATEDHDYEEISSLNIGSSSFKWTPGFPPAACGGLPVNGMIDFIEEIRKASGDSDLFRALAECYRTSTDLAQATRRMVHYLFQGSPLLVIDGNDPLLKSRFVVEMLDDAFSNNAHRLVSETASVMEGRYDVQVTPREINLFYLEAENRGRIVSHPDRGYEVTGSSKTFTSADLEAEIREHPERFSPNVIMRPLYQEKILPDLAYVGGPGEIAYWLELKTVFEHYKIPFPVLMPRCSFLIADHVSVRKASKLGLKPEDLFAGREALIRKLVAAPDALNAGLDRLKNELTGSFDSIAGLIKDVDQTLLASLEGEKQKSLKSVALLEEKVIRALKRKHENTITQLDGLLARLMPSGSLQERHQNILAITGDRKFVDEIIAACDPFGLSFDILLTDEPSSV